MFNFCCKDNKIIVNNLIIKRSFFINYPKIGCKYSEKSMIIATFAKCKMCSEHI